MSVVASSRPEAAAVPYNAIPQSVHNHICNYRTSAYSVTTKSVPSGRPSSVSSFKTNYSVASAPAIYSPTSPTVLYPPPFSSATSLLPQHQTSASVFRRLPQNVYDIILNELQYLHTGPRQSGCLTCFQRDLHALSLTSRAWEKAVRAKL